MNPLTSVVSVESVAHWSQYHRGNTSPQAVQIKRLSIDCFRSTGRIVFLDQGNYKLSRE